MTTTETRDERESEHIDWIDQLGPLPSAEDLVRPFCDALNALSDALGERGEALAWLLEFGTESEKWRIASEECLSVFADVERAVRVCVDGLTVPYEQCGGGAGASNVVRSVCGGRAIDQLYRQLRFVGGWTDGERIYV